MISPAKISDAAQLSEIAYQSKAFWKYSKPQLEIWREELTVKSHHLENSNGFVYKIDDKIVGFYSLEMKKNSTIFLEFLFVLPEFIGKGIGKELLLHAFQKSKETNALVINVLADSNAEKFYLKNGFVTISLQASSIKRRFLPLMEKYL